MINQWKLVVLTWPDTNTGMVFRRKDFSACINAHVDTSVALDTLAVCGLIILLMSWSKGTAWKWRK